MYGNTFTLDTDTVYIHLNNNHSALIDREDLERVLEYDWHAEELRRADGSTKQVVVIGTVKDKKKGKKKTVKLHRYLLDAPHDKWVRHLDGDGLNNTKGNLLFVKPHTKRAISL